jgi:hypothetical protein
LASINRKWKLADLRLLFMIENRLNKKGHNFVLTFLIACRRGLLLPGSKRSKNA